MRRSLQTALPAVILCAAFPAAADEIGFPQRIEPFIFPSARFAALGGTHTAVADDAYVFFSNPAGFANIERGLSAAEISVDVQDFNTMLNIYFGAASQLDTVVTNTYFAAADASGPLALSWINRGWGLGLFNATRLELHWQSGAQDYVESLTEEFTLAGGYAWRAGDVGNTTFDFGVMGKIFYRAGYFKEWDDLVEARYLLADISDVEKSKDYPFQSQLGVGADLGLRLTWAEAISWALTFRDLFAPVLVTNYENFYAFQEQRILGSAMSKISSGIGVGFAIRIPFASFHRYITDLTFMMDFSGLSEFFALTPRDMLLDLSGGVELRLLRALSLRGGWHEMMPAGGLGINMRAWKMDFAFYGQEFGSVSGEFQAYSLAVSILFRYGGPQLGVR